MLHILPIYTYRGYVPNVFTCTTQIHPVQADIVAVADTSAIYWPTLGDRQCLKSQ